MIACVVGATRILYALSRDGLGTPALGTVHEKTGTPVRALTVVTAAAAIIILGYRVLFTTSLFNVFLWSGVIGTLILLVAYILATLGAIRLLWFSGPAKSPIWQAIIPGAALIVLLATIYYNVDPDAARAFRWTYYTAGIWVIARRRPGRGPSRPLATGRRTPVRGRRARRPRSSRARRSTRRTRQATDRCSDLTAYAA